MTDTIMLPHHRRQRVLLLALIVVAIVVMILGLVSGTYHIAWHEYLAILQGDSHLPSYTVISELRAPRVYNAFTTGGLLALAGVLMQVLLRNPLAEPYVLGISGGASVAVLLLILVGATGVLLHLGAFAGAFLSMMLVFALARGEGNWTPTRLLLTGVVLAAGWGAVITFVLSVAPEHNLRGMLFWLLGDLSYATASSVTLTILLIGVLLGWVLARSLNLLVIGQLQAKTLGVNVERLQWQLFVLASLLTAVAVMQAGSIGFIGLVVPHLLRLQGLHDHRYLVPASVLAGGSLLVIADTLSRSLFITVSLPVGVFTAMLGVPVFLWLLHRQSRSLP